jgi:hypothetical protein
MTPVDYADRLFRSLGLEPTAEMKSKAIAEFVFAGRDLLCKASRVIYDDAQKGKILLPEQAAAICNEQADDLLYYT